MGQLKVQGIQDVRDVFYANLDEQNNLYIDQYRDKIQKN